MNWFPLKGSVSNFSLSVMLLGGILLSDFSNAKSLRVTQNANGPTGLVMMPTARMFDEGEWSIQFSGDHPYTRYVVTAQPLPWLQALFKYTDIATKPYGPASFSGSQTYKDKSTDIKVRLVKETYFLPEVSLGINDIGGTGLFSGEYLTASKQIKNMDFTLGMGWGYLGKREHLKNPFTYLSSFFDSRASLTGNAGNLTKFKPFSGKGVSLFGGAEYHFDSLPLVAKVEYDANNYRNEPAGGDLKQDIPINFDVVYSPSKHVDLHAGVVRGNTLMLGLSLRTNLTSKGPEKYFDPKPVEVNDSTVYKSTRDWKDVANEISLSSGYAVESIEKGDGSVIVSGQPKAFQDSAMGIGRVARVLVNQEELEDVNSIVVSDTAFGQEVVAVKLDKATFEKAANLEIDQSEILEKTEFLPGSEKQNSDSVKSMLFDSKQHRFNYQILPFFAASYGGPDSFVLYQLGLSLDTNYFLNKNRWASGSVQLGLADNYNLYKVDGYSKLPPVRTYIKDYLKTSKLRIQNLQFNDFEKLGDNWFAIGYAGYLESMYAGVGAEVMYRPLGNWAVGLDLNHVKQRDFDQRFGLRDYSVTTGHLTGYYENKDDILFKVSAGRYLAKDVGVTIDFSRKFRSGARLGFWATKTNVSAEDFGEGSFDKGFYMTFPMNLFTFKSTRDTANFRWQFLTRDGGQKLVKKYELYDMTDTRSLKFMKNSFDHVLR
ncbi:YjbH domain-containing protein [Thiomicrorhabdus sediminis]|nr:YjbH domain-containing protein [Thiomicrorhabdus sediminis]